MTMYLDFNRFDAETQRRLKHYVQQRASGVPVVTHSIKDATAPVLDSESADSPQEEDGDYIPPTKEELMNDFRESLRDMHLYMKGKLKLKTLDEVIDEIRHSTATAL
jgi:hypothetical protein